MQTEAKPAVPEHIVIVPHGNNIVEFRKGTWHARSIILTDESDSGSLYRICAALDGTRTIHDVAKLTKTPANSVADVVDTLTDLQLVVMDPIGLLRLGTVALLGAESSRLRLRFKDVLVIGDREISDSVIEAISPALGELGVAVSSVSTELIDACRVAGTTYDALEREKSLLGSDWMRDRFVVYCNSHVDPITCKGLNLCFMHHHTPWLYAAVDGPFVLIGPLFVPGDTSCFECFETRIAMNLRDNKSYVEYKQALASGLAVRSGTSPIIRLLYRLLASHTAIEAFNFAFSGRSTLIDKMLAIHIPSMEFSYHEVLRMPYCSACGAKPDRDASELYFSIREVFTSEDRS